MNAMYWLILLIVLVVIEIITLGLTTIWFAGGALVTFILAMLDVSPVIQWVVFCAVSLADWGDTPLRFAAMIPLQVYNTLRVPEERKRLEQTDILIIGGIGIYSMKKLCIQT